MTQKAIKAIIEENPGDLLAQARKAQFDREQAIRVKNAQKAAKASIKARRAKAAEAAKAAKVTKGTEQVKPVKAPVSPVAALTAQMWANAEKAAARAILADTAKK